MGEYTQKKLNLHNKKQTYISTHVLCAHVLYVCEHIPDTLKSHVGLLGKCMCACTGLFGVQCSKQCPSPSL